MIGKLHILCKHSHNTFRSGKIQTFTVSFLYPPTTGSGLILGSKELQLDTMPKKPPHDFSQITIFL